MSTYPARALLPLAMLGTLAACADRPLPLDPQAPENTPGPAALQSLSCTADVRAGTVFCDSGTGPSGEGSRLITGGQNVYVRMASSNPAYAGGTFTFDGTVQNLIPQTLGVGADGLADGNGVSVVFWQEPVATEGTGDITINGALTGMFTRSGERYYRYDQTLAQDQTSDPRQWSFTVPATVVRFGFSVYVAASVQYPDGWVEITGAPDLRVARGSILSLSAVVRNAVGRMVKTTGPVTWSLADTSVATISGSTLTAAARSGYTTLSATVGNRTGSARLVVGTPFTRLATGNMHSCGLTPDGRAFCWGSNFGGGLGDGTLLNRHAPVAVHLDPARYVQITAGMNHTCALSVSGQAYCWGWNDHGQLGDNSTVRRLTPVPVQQGGAGYVEIAAGSVHTCARTSTGQVYCWGGNEDGSLGDGTTIESHTPVAVHQPGMAYAQITAGGGHTCAVSSSGQAYCWGRNYYGQLGDSTMDRQMAPVPVRQGGTLYEEIAAGGQHTCARSSAGQDYCWGTSEYGQLGDDTYDFRSYPAPVHQGAATYVRISAGYGVSCGLTSTGQASCWGDNWFGTLGDGTNVDRLTPVHVLQGSIPYRTIATGGPHVCAASPIGRTYCWGANGDGQLGDNTTNDRNTPVEVM